MEEAKRQTCSLAPSCLRWLGIRAPSPAHRGGDPMPILGALLAREGSKKAEEGRGVKRPWRTCVITQTEIPRAEDVRDVALYEIRE